MTLVTIVLLIVSKVQLAHFDAPALCREGQSHSIKKSISSDSSPLMHYIYTIKHIISNRENGLMHFCIMYTIDNFIRTPHMQHTNQTMPIPTKSLSCVGINRAIQKGQESRCRSLDYPFT